MKPRYLLFVPFVILALVGVVIADDGADDDPAEPQRPGITRVGPGTDIREIASDPFQLDSAVVEGNVLKITVTYAGGREEHAFALYWSGISTRSRPPQLPMVLKHDANGDMAEALITRTIEFDLGALNRHAIINIRTDHGDSARVEYGERLR
ncbi:MAG: hypothetical protein AAGC44_15700 [Planctomycetota bacterium]